MTLLVPRMGAQGSDTGETVPSAFDTTDIGFIINVSHQIMHAVKIGGVALRIMGATIREACAVSRRIRDETNCRAPLALKEGLFPGSYSQPVRNTR